MHCSASDQYSACQAYSKMANLHRVDAIYVCGINSSTHSLTRFYPKLHMQLQSAVLYLTQWFTWPFKWLLEELSSLWQKNDKYGINCGESVKEINSKIASPDLQTTTAIIERLGLWLWRVTSTSWSCTRTTYCCRLCVQVLHICLHNCSRPMLLIVC